MKNTHCCQCGKPRGLAPISKGFRLDSIASGIFYPCPAGEVVRTPAPGVYLEQSPSMIIVAQAYRNGGCNDEVHICTECTTKSVRHIRDSLTIALGEIPTNAQHHPRVASAVCDVVGLTSTTVHERNHMRIETKGIVTYASADNNIIGIAMLSPGQEEVRHHRVYAKVEPKDVVFGKRFRVIITDETDETPE